MLRFAALAALVAAGIGALALASSGSGRAAPSSGPAPALGPASALGPLSPAPDPGALGPENVPVPAAPPLAPPGAIAPGQTVDGISSAQVEQVAYHIHVHLTIFVRGAQRQIPAGVGIAPPVQVQQTAQGPFAAGGTGFAWLHTHAADGIVHIESPLQSTYTLGSFFDIWGQPLGVGQVGPARGPVTVFVNGRHYQGNPRDAPLRSHAQIQLDVGRPLVAPASIQFPGGL